MKTALLCITLFISLLLAAGNTRAEYFAPDLVISISVNSTDVQLHWSRLPGAGSYRVYAGDSLEFPISESAQIGTTTDTTFTQVNALLDVVMRFYTVIAIPADPTPLIYPHDSTVPLMIPIQLDGMQTKKSSSWSSCRNQSAGSVSFSAKADTILAGVADSAGHNYRLFRASFISDTVNNGTISDSFAVARGHYSRIDSVQLCVWVHGGTDVSDCDGGLYAVLIKDATPTIYSGLLSSSNYTKYLSTGWKDGPVTDRTAFDSLEIPTGEGDHELIFRSEAYTARFDSLRLNCTRPCQFYVQVVSCSDYNNDTPGPDPHWGITYPEKLFGYYSEAESMNRRPCYKVYWSEHAYPLTAGVLSMAARGITVARLVWTSTPGGVVERLQQHDPESDRWSDVPEANSSPFVVRGLSPRGSYDFRVAYSDGRSDSAVYSNTVRVQVDDPGCVWSDSMIIVLDSTTAQTTLSRYPVRIVFDRDDSLLFLSSREQGEDIRFRKADGLEDLPFFQERFSRAERSASYFVRIDSLYHTRADTIWCYFGCASAGSASNGDSTFLLFDDFKTTERVDSFSSLADFTNITMDTTSACIATGSWDKAMRENANIVFFNDTFRTWYSADTIRSYRGVFERLGYAYSLDGKTWTKYAGNPVYGQIGPVDTLGLEDAFVVPIGDTLFCVFEWHLSSGTSSKDSVKMMWSLEGVDWTAYPNSVMSGNLGSPTMYYDPTDSLTGDTVFCMDEIRPDFMRLTGSTDHCRTFNTLVDTVFARSFDPSYYDATTVVPDDIHKIGGVYYLTYHGYRSGGGNVFYTFMATAASLRGPWTRYDKRPIAYAQSSPVFPTIMWYQDRDGLWRGLGTATTDAAIYMVYPKKWTPAQWTDPRFTPGRAGVDRLYGTGGFVSDTASLCPSIYTDGEYLHLTADQNIMGSGYIKTALRDTSGVCLMIRKKSSGYRGKPFLTVSAGADTLIGTYNLAAKSGYVWGTDSFMPTACEIEESGGWPLADNGSFMAPLALTTDSFAEHEFYYSQAYHGHHRLGWMIDDTLRSPADASDDRDQSAMKLWLISQGEFSGYGGETVIDWIAIRPYCYPEPTYTKWQ